MDLKTLSDAGYDYGSALTMLVGAIVALFDLPLVPEQQEALAVLLLAVVTLVAKWHSNRTDVPAPAPVEEPR